VLLLFLVFYLYAIAGMELFRDNDPFHWNTLPNALLTLFRCATLEDWTDVMYFGIYGCDDYKTGGGITYCDVFAEECAGDWEMCEPRSISGVEGEASGERSEAKRSEPVTTSLWCCWRAASEAS